MAGSRTIIDLDKKHMTAIARRDIPTLNTLLSDDPSILTHPHGSTPSRA